MTIFTQILYELATKHVVAKSTLLTLGSLTHPIYRQIKRLKEMGLIKDIPCLIKSKKDRTQKTIDCLILTVKGIDYIRNNLCADIPWAEYLTPADDAIIISDHYDKTRLALRFTRISTAGVIADIIGACESTVFFNENNSSPEDTSRPCLMSIVRDAMQAYQDAMNRPADEKSDKSSANPIQFHSALKIKRLAAGINSSMSNDMRGDRYSGMIVSPQRSALVYVLSCNTRLIWSHRAVFRELRAYSVLRQNGLISAAAVRSPCGLLLVENDKALSCALRANEEARKKQKQSKDIRAFGEGLDHLWVSPITYEGNLEVRDLMVADLAKENQSIIDLLTRRLDLEPNDEYDADVFPLFDLFYEVKYAIGIHIDINQILAINRGIQRHDKAPAKGLGDQDYSYVLYCRAWQIPYYQEIVDPRVKLVAIDDFC